MPLTRKAVFRAGAAVVVAAAVGIGLAAAAGGAASSSASCPGTKVQGAARAALDEAERLPIGRWATPTFGQLVTHHRLPPLPSGTGWRIASSTTSGPVVTVTLAHRGERTQVPVSIVCSSGRWRISDQGVAVTRPAASVPKS